MEPVPEVLGIELISDGLPQMRSCCRLVKPPQLGVVRAKLTAVHVVLRNSGTWSCSTAPSNCRAMLM